MINLNTGIQKMLERIYTESIVLQLHQYSGVFFI